MYRLFWAAAVYLLAPKGGPVVRYTYIKCIASRVGARVYKLYYYIIYLLPTLLLLQTSKRETPTGGAAG